MPHNDDAVCWFRRCWFLSWIILPVLISLLLLLPVGFAHSEGSGIINGGWIKIIIWYPCVALAWTDPFFSFQGRAGWGQIWATTPGWPTPGPPQTSRPARSPSTAARANWTPTDITTVRALTLWGSSSAFHELVKMPVCSLSSRSRQLPVPHGETQHGVQRQPHLQHHQHHRRGRPADLLWHLLQCVLQPGAGPLQQQPGAVRQRPRGSGPGRGSLDHPVRPVWLWVRQTPVHQEEQRWAFQRYAKLNKQSWCVSIIRNPAWSCSKFIPDQRVLFLSTVVRLWFSLELSDRFSLQFCPTWENDARQWLSAHSVSEIQGSFKVLPGMSRTASFSYKAQGQTICQFQREVSYVNRRVSAVMVFFFFLDKLVKQRSTGSSPKSAPLTWVDVLSLPLSVNRDPPKNDKSQHRSVVITVNPQFCYSGHSCQTKLEWSSESGEVLKLAAAAFPGRSSLVAEWGASPITSSDRRDRGHNRGLPRLCRVFLNDISSHLTGQIST